MVSGQRWRMNVVGACKVFALAACALVALSSVALAKIVVEGRPGEVTALQVSTTGPPRPVHGSDGREHLEYNLAITNAFTSDATLQSLAVTSGGRTLLRLNRTQVAAQTHEIIAGNPSGQIPASATAVTIVDIVLPKSAGRTWPRRIVNEIRYSLPPGARFRQVIGSLTVPGPALSSTRRQPVVIASPLRGAGWVSANGCCAASSVHRNIVLSANGSYVTPEMFAIDWARAVKGSFFTGDGSKLGDYPYFGDQIHAVANGTVVSTITNRPEVPPGASANGNPTVRHPEDFGGNQIIEKIGPGLYAAYEHLQTGSVMVRRGQRLRTGQVIARLGNTGNTTFPHLHFGIQDGPDILTSNALPFELNRFTLQGTISPTATPSHIPIIGPSRSERRSYPLFNAVAAFGNG